MAASIDKDIPQWKKDLILRRRNQNKRLTTGTENKQLFSLSPQSKSDAVGRAGHQPRITTAVPVTCSNGEVVEKCTAHSSSVSDKMVQERTWSNKQCAYEVTKNENGDNKSDSDSSEDLHYGPGIVNKLKNRYLSLALRENNTKSRPSILHMRKATSLENLLDNDNCIDSRETTESRLFDSKLNNCNDVTKNVPYRYRRGSRSDMKRAHSVETISRTDHNTFSVEQKPKRESMHEEMLITNIGNDRGNKEISDKVPEIPVSNKMFAIINKPKRIAPIMNEREKPPVDVVKQTKRIFEGRPEQRTKPLHTTGEVAAKVATYKSIIVQTKANKKPLIKQKPSHSVLADKNRRTNHPPVIRPAAKTQERLENSNAPSQHNIPQNKTHSLPSLIPDVSKTNEFSTANRQGNKRISSLSETPDLILHSSPSIVSPSYRIESTRTFLSEEIKNCYKFVVSETKVRAQVNKDTPDCLPARHVTPDSGKSASSKPGNSVTYNFSNAHQNESFPRNQQGVLAQPSKSAVNGIAHNETISLRPIVNTGSPPKLVQAQLSKNESITDPVNNIKPSLTVREIENNSINAAKTLERPPSGNRESVLKVEVTKVKKPARAQEQNSIVFKFTDRKDIPDYVGNDGLSRIGKVERPKVKLKKLLIVFSFACN